MSVAPLEATAAGTALGDANVGAGTAMPGVTPGTPARSRRKAAPAPSLVRQGAPRPPKKAARAADCRMLEQLPNVGPSIAADLRSIGIAEPGDLAACDAMALYRALCARTGRRQDPCVLDTFIAAVDFMQGAPAAPWWRYTAQRKARFGVV